jgi:hypothetical protein
MRDFLYWLANPRTPNDCPTCGALPGHQRPHLVTSEEDIVDDRILCPNCTHPINNHQENRRCATGTTPETLCECKWSPDRVARHLLGRSASSRRKGW